MGNSSTTAVLAGISANAVVCVGKSVAFAFSGSGAMLSEAIHSLADTVNQALLLVGLRRSVRGPDARHPEGYGRERFFWGLVSALGIFFVGSGVTLYHGIHGLLHPEPAHHTWITWAVLGGSMVLEGAAFAVAWRGLAADARAVGIDPMAYAREGRDPTTSAILLEDGAALLGLLLAVGGIALEHVTGSPVWDSLATVLIGLLLGAVALFLIAINRTYLLSRSIEPEVAAAVSGVLAADPVVDGVKDLRGVILTLGRYKIQADVDFRGETLAEAILERDGLERWRGEPDDDAERLGAFAEEVVSELGRQVERLDKKVRQAVPGVAHLDLEADPGHDEAPPVPNHEPRDES